MTAKIDMTGKIYGRLTVLAPALDKKWHCRCECGALKEILGYSLRSGNTTSCGCLRSESLIARSTTHGMAGRGAKHPMYHTWQGIIGRCTYPSHKDYAGYGGRGITVSEDWKIFENFYRDMGDRPPGLTIERRNNDEGYSKENCYWATDEQQRKNTRKSQRYEYNGKKMSLTDLSRISGFSLNTLLARFKKGMSVEEAVSTKLKGS